MLAMLTCILASCSDGGSDNPVDPTPKPEEVKAEISIDSNIVSNGLSFGVASGEQTVSFSANTNWTLSVASTTSGATWCKASATSGSKGTANVKFTVDENTGYDDRSVSVTIKAGSVSKTFTITQKGADALLVTTNKYEVAQEGGKIEVEVKANINYELAISETAKDWITESKSRALTTHKHTFEIALNEESEKREGEITFKSSDKVETVKVYQAGGAILLLSQNEFTVSDAGETISVDIKSNIEYGVQMPDVDWITDENSSRGMSSHTLKYVIAPNEGYDTRSAEIIFYDKNSDLKDTLNVIQAQKDAIVISQKTYDVKAEGETIEVKLSANVDFEITMPEVDWISQTESRTLTEHTLYFKVSENASDEDREAKITFTNKDSHLKESITVNQKCPIQAGYENGIVTIAIAGTMKELLGDDYLNITSLKVVGPINGDDVYYLRKMLGGSNFSEVDWGKLTTLDLSEASIVEGGGAYTDKKGYVYTKGYTENNIIGEYMFSECANLQSIILPNTAISINSYAFGSHFYFKNSLNSVIIGNSVTSIGDNAFQFCDSLTSVNIPNSVITIGQFAFYSCEKLTSIVIGDNVTTIGEFAFSSCEKLTSITMGNNVSSIDNNAFAACHAVTSVSIKDISSWCKIQFDFSSSNPLNGGAKLYLNNEELNELKVPEDVIEIKNYAFYNCDNITKVIIHDGVTSIGKDAFSDCNVLTEVTIGNGVTSIGKNAFSDCNVLTEVTIGKSITEISNEAFIHCSIMNFYCYAVTPPSFYIYNGATIPFYDIDEEAKLYVPEKCGTVYNNAFGWSIFNNIIEMD